MSRDTLHTTRQALRAARLLTDGPMSRYQLAEVLGVSDRTALRIAQMLVALGIATADTSAGRTGPTLYVVPRGRRFREISA